MKTFSSYRYDLLFLFRYGFIQAYAFVSLIYCSVIFTLPPGSIRILVSVSLAYSDISMLGCIFTGAALHLEKQSGTIKAVGILPLSSFSFTLRRTLTLSAVSTFFALLVVVSGGGFQVSFPAVAAGAFICAATFTFLGTSVMTRTGNLARFIIIAGLLTLPSGLPLIRYLGLGSNTLFLVLPGAGGLMLMDRATGSLSPGGGVPATVIVLNSTIWLGIFSWLASVDFRKRLVEGV